MLEIVMLKCFGCSGSLVRVYLEQFVSEVQCEGIDISLKFEEILGESSGHRTLWSELIIELELCDTRPVFLRRFPTFLTDNLILFLFFLLLEWNLPGQQLDKDTPK